MTPEDHTSEIRADWVNRQRELGNKPRAVLMKGLHASINDTIDAWHRAILRAAFPGSNGDAPALPALDIGCGYGRLADQALECGLSPVFGIDFAQGFCADFNRHYGPAVCGDLSALPFREGSFSDAYSVTSLMYLPFDKARRAVLEIDRCTQDGARILLVEPSREFNSLVRAVLRRKRNEILTMPGFSRDEFTEGLPPAHWRLVSGGSCNALTALLPLLMVTARVPVLFRWLSRLALHLDAPRTGATRRPARVCMYRWAVYRKCAESQTNRPAR